MAILGSVLRAISSVMRLVWERRWSSASRTRRASWLAALSDLRSTSISSAEPALGEKERELGKLRTLQSPFEVGFHTAAFYDIAKKYMKKNIKILAESLRAISINQRGLVGGCCVNDPRVQIGN